MTPQPPDLRTQWLRQWRSSILRVESAADDGEIRRAEFDRLQEQDFEPDAMLEEALRIERGHTGAKPLARRDLQSPPVGRRAITLGGLQSIDAFSRVYFEISPDERGQQWEKLWEVSESCPLLQYRLSCLKSALTLPVKLPETMPAGVGELVRVLQSVYVSSPRLRQALQAELFTPNPDLQPGDDRQDPDAEQLCEQFPEWKVLNPSLLDGLRYADYVRSQRQRWVDSTEQDFAVSSASPEPEWESEWVRMAEQWGFWIPRICIRLLFALGLYRFLRWLLSL